MRPFFQRKSGFMHGRLLARVLAGGFLLFPLSFPSRPFVATAIPCGSPLAAVAFALCPWHPSQVSQSAVEMGEIDNAIDGRQATDSTSAFPASPRLPTPVSMTSTRGSKLSLDISLSLSTPLSFFLPIILSLRPVHSLK